jgi:hypothetical protein
MKARRLSDKKIHIACETKIFFRGDDGEILIDTINTRFVYKKTNSTYADGTPVAFYCANIKNGFVAGICGKYGIKKKHVFFPHRERPGKRFEVDVEGEKVLVVFNDVLLTDKDWYTAWNRERQLNSLLQQ